MCSHKLFFRFIFVVKKLITNNNYLMKNKFFFLSLLLYISSCLIIQNQLWAQKAANLPISFNSFSSCGNTLQLDWTTPRTHQEKTDQYLIQYITACQKPNDINYKSQWTNLSTDASHAALSLNWGQTVDANIANPSHAYCQALIPKNCSPTVIVIVYSLIDGVYVPSNPSMFQFACLSCMATGIYASVVDIQLFDLNEPLPCNPNSPNCLSNISIIGKTTSMAYSPKDITLSTKPNPFGSQTTIEYTLTKEATVSLQVFDLQGRTVAQLLDHQKQAAGKQQQIWNAQHLPSGVYYYQLNVDGYTQTKKLVKF